MAESPLHLSLSSLESCEKLRPAIRELRACARVNTPLLIDGDLSTVLILVRELVSARGIAEVLCAMLGPDTRLLDALPSRADGDVLMISEAHRLSEEDQHLLHVIAERGTVRHDARPLGGRLIVHYDTRVASALASGGRYFRISVPRLSQHPEDAPMLVELLLRQRLGEVVRLSDGARNYLGKQSWKGDLAELLQLAERLVFESQTAALPEVIEARHVGAVSETTPELDESDIKPGKLSAMMAEVERRILKRTLEELDWNKSAAARRLGISRSYLIQKAHLYGLEGPDAEWSWKRHREKAS